MDESQFSKKYDKLVNLGVRFPLESKYSTILDPKPESPGLVKTPVAQISAQDAFRERPDFTKKQQKSAEEVVEELVKQRQSLVSWLLGQPADSIDLDDLSTRLQGLTGILRENRDILRQFDADHPDLLGPERQLLLDLVTVLSQAQEGSISNSELQEFVELRSEELGLAGSGAKKPATGDRLDSRESNPERGQGRDRTARLQPIAESNEATDKEADDGNEMADQGSRVSSDFNRSRRSNLKPDLSGARSRAGQQDHNSFNKDKSRNEDGKPGFDWGFKTDNKRPSIVVVKPEEDQENPWEFSNVSQKDEDAINWGSRSGTAKVAPKQKLNEDFFADFGNKEDDEEPGNFAFKRDSSLKDESHDKIQARKPVTTSQPKEVNLSRSEIASKRSLNKSRADQMDKSRQGFNFDDFGEASQEVSGQVNESFKGSIGGQSRTKLKLAVPHKYVATDKSKLGGDSLQQSRQNESIGNISKGLGETFKDFFEKSKAEVSMSREERGSRRRRPSTSVKIGPPQPKVIVNPVAGLGATAQKSGLPNNFKSRESSDREIVHRWNDTDKKSQNDDKADQNRSNVEVKDKPKPIATSAIEMKKPAKPFASLFEEDDQPVPSNVSFRRAQMRNQSRNDSYSREDRLAMSVPAIVGTGGGFSRQRNRGSSIRINRSIVGDTGVAGGKMIGTVSEQNPSNMISLKSAVQRPSAIVTVETPKVATIAQPAKEAVTPEPLVAGLVDPFAQSSPQELPPAKTEIPENQKSQVDWWDMPEDSAKNTPAKKATEMLTPAGNFWGDDEFGNDKEIGESQIVPDVEPVEHSYPKLEEVKPQHSLPIIPTPVFEKPDKEVSQQKSKVEEEPQVFNFDDFDAASDGNEENVEDGFGDASLVSQDKKATDPFNLITSQAFSGKPTIGDHQFRHPIDSEVDNPDFFNSKEFGQVGGLGMYEVVKKQPRLEDSIVSISPIKHIEEIAIAAPVRLSIQFVSPLIIYGDQKPPVRLSRQAFHLISKPAPLPRVLSSSSFTAALIAPRPRPQLSTARLPSLLVGHSGIKAAPTAPQLPSATVDTDLINSLERDLRTERSERLRIAKDFETTLQSAAATKQRFNDLMAKHTEALKVVDDLRTENERLRAVEEARRSGLVREIATDSEEVAKGEPGVLEEFQRRIEVLSKENVELRYRVVEAEVNLQVKQSYKGLEESTLADIQQAVDRLTSEKKKWQERAFELENEVHRLKEGLADKDELSLEVDLIKKVLGMDGDEGAQAIAILRSLLKDNLEQNLGKSELLAKYAPEQPSREVQVSLQVDIFPSLIQVEPTLTRPLEASKEIADSTPESNLKRPSVFESFGGSLQQMEPKTGQNDKLSHNLSVETFGAEKAQPFSHPEDKEEVIFDSFAPEALPKQPFLHSSFGFADPEAQVEQPENIFALSQPSDLKPIEEILQENQEQSPVTSPPTEKVRTDAPEREVIRPEPTEVLLSVEALHQVDPLDVPVVEAEEPELETCKEDQKQDEIMVDEKKLDHCGSWASEDFFHSAFTPKDLAAVATQGDSPSYKSLLARSVKPETILDFLDNEDHIFLKGDIQLALLECVITESNVALSVAITAKDSCITLKEIAIKNYESYAIMLDSELPTIKPAESSIFNITLQYIELGFLLPALMAITYHVEQDSEAESLETLIPITVLNTLASKEQAPSNISFVCLESSMPRLSAKVSAPNYERVFNILKRLFRDFTVDEAAPDSLLGCFAAPQRPDLYLKLTHASDGEPDPANSVSILLVSEHLDQFASSVLDLLTFLFAN